MIKIKYLNGIRLKSAIIAGANEISNNQGHLNEINFFPIADHDTGTNLSTMMNNITADLSSNSSLSVSEISKIISDSALLHAQGNSGAILAQFFCGFSKAIKDKNYITAKDFTNAIKKAKSSTIKAMTDLIEGTIITVITDWINYIEKSSKQSPDFFELIGDSLKIAQQSLRETTKKLEVLAKAGVVDAGAQGFVNLLEGIYQFIEKSNRVTVYQ